VDEGDSSVIHSDELKKLKVKNLLY